MLNEIGCFGPVFGQSWPQDPSERVRLNNKLQNPPKISSLDQLQSQFVANSLSKPKTNIKNGCLADSEENKKHQPPNFSHNIDKMHLTVSHSATNRD
jgi:hypothetical protein